MRHFILEITYTFIISFLILEMVLRLFHLAGITVPEENINDNRLLKPKSEGYWVKGGLGEIRSHYIINNQGFNSIVDYDQDIREGKLVALIGDSYIEGLHVDVENSIGRIIESNYPELQVHEYGRAGANIADYSQVYQKWIKDRYDYVFIYISNTDLEETTPGFMNMGYQIPKSSILRLIYNRIHVLRYLNINHGMVMTLKSLMNIDKTNSMLNSSFVGLGSGNYMEDNFNNEALQQLGSEVIYLYEKGGLDSVFVANNNCYEIIHKYLPKDFGFDSHWNINGRRNCANAIINYLIENKALN